MINLESTSYKYRKIYKKKSLLDLSDGQIPMSP